MANFGPLAAEMVWLFGATQVISTGFTYWQRYCTTFVSDIAIFVQKRDVKLQLTTARHSSIER